MVYVLVDLELRGIYSVEVDYGLHVLGGNFRDGFGQRDFESYRKEFGHLSYKKAAH